MIALTHIEYYQDTNNIHHFQFNQMSYQAVDEWMETMQHIMKQDGQLRAIVFDITETAPPFQYFMNKLREFQRHYFLSQEVRTAFVYESGTGLLSSFRTLIKSATLMSNFSIRFFPAEMAEQAYEWFDGA